MCVFCVFLLLFFCVFFFFFLTFCVLLADNSVSDFIAFLRIPWFRTPAVSVEMCLFLLLLLGFVLVII